MKWWFVVPYRLSVGMNLHQGLPSQTSGEELLRHEKPIISCV